MQACYELNRMLNLQGTGTENAKRKTADETAA
jgi:hypothetical protein